MRLLTLRYVRLTVSGQERVGGCGFPLALGCNLLSSLILILLFFKEKVAISLEVTRTHRIREYWNWVPEKNYKVGTDADKADSSLFFLC